MSVWMFLAYICVALPGIVAGRLVRPMIFTPCLTTSLPGSVPSTLPPISAAMSTMTLPGFMLFTISSVTSRGAGRPGMRAVVMTKSASLTRSAISSAWRRL